MGRGLEAIGIHAMTNREAFIEELDAMTDSEFDHFVAHTRFDADLDRSCCLDCKAAHGGECIHQEDNADCKDYKRVCWWSKPCRHERLLPEVTA